jgi:hypothetical protein
MPSEKDDLVKNYKQRLAEGESTFLSRKRKQSEEDFIPDIKSAKYNADYYKALSKGLGDENEYSGLIQTGLSMSSGLLGELATNRDLENAKIAETKSSAELNNMKAKAIDAKLKWQNGGGR